VSFSRVINLYLNLDTNAGNPLVSGLSNKESRATLQFIQGDIAALSGTSTSLAVKCDIELQNADNTQRLTYQFDGSVLRQVYDGEADPTPGTPSYPLPAMLLLTTNLSTAEVEIGSDTVDFDITALGLATAPAMCIPFGIQKPGDAADNISIISAFPVNATTLRAYLTAAPSEAGYKATVFFR